MPTEADNAAVMAQQATYGHVPTCAICMSNLMDKDEFMQEMKLAMWQNCGHIFHLDCLEQMHGPLPRTGRVPMPATLDDEGFPLYEEDDYRDCPQCPLCNGLDVSCEDGMDCNNGEFCDPIQIVYLNSDDSAGNDPFPFNINVNGDTRHLFDLAAVASAAGIEVDKLVKEAKKVCVFDEYGDTGNEGLETHVENLDEAYEKIEKIVMRLQRDKARFAFPAAVTKLNDNLSALMGGATYLNEIACLRERLDDLEDSNEHLRRNPIKNAEDLSEAHRREIRSLNKAHFKAEKALRSEIKRKEGLRKATSKSFAGWQDEYTRLEERNEELKEKNRELKEQLAEREREIRRQKRVNVEPSAPEKKKLAPIFRKKAVKLDGSGPSVPRGSRPGKSAAGRKRGLRSTQDNPILIDSSEDELKIGASRPPKRRRTSP